MVEVATVVVLLLYREVELVCHSAAESCEVVEYRSMSAWRQV